MLATIDRDYETHQLVIFSVGARCHRPELLGILQSREIHSPENHMLPIRAVPHEPTHVSTGECLFVSAPPTSSSSFAAPSTTFMQLPITAIVKTCTAQF